MSQVWEEIKEYLEEVTLEQGLETRLIYPLSTVSTVPRAHSSLRSPQKSVSILIYFKIRRKSSIRIMRNFPGGSGVKNPPANAGDTGSSPGPGRSHMPWSS